MWFGNWFKPQAFIFNSSVCLTWILVFKRFKGQIGKKTLFLYKFVFKSSCQIPGGIFSWPGPRLNK